MKLGFGALPDGVSAGSTAEATVSITDDDVPSVTASFGQSSYTVAEGSTVEVSVTLSADPERTVIIPIIRTNQDGASNGDYSVPASVTFNSGDTEKSFAFTAAQDDDNDDGESVKLAFGTMPGGVSAGTPGTATVSITDDDVPAVTVSFGSTTYTVTEGGAQTVTVTLSADPERTVTIPITKANQDGASSADYSGVPSSVTFNSGDTEKTIIFSAAQDDDNDDGESVKLTLGNLPDGVSAVAPTETTVVITDDDDPQVTVSFEQPSYSVPEGGSASVKVTLSADPERTVTIPIETMEQDGASSVDYSGVPSSVTFNSGDTEKSFIFTAAQDDDNDDGESVKLGFGAMPGGVSAGTPTHGDGVDHRRRRAVRDGELRAVKLHGGRGEHGGGLGDPERGPGAQVTIPITKAGQDGATSADYSGVPASVTFNSHVRRRSPSSSPPPRTTTTTTVSR